MNGTNCDRKKKYNEKEKKKFYIFLNPFETYADLVIHKIWNAARIMVVASDPLPKPNVIHTPSRKH